jgi:thiol:disulfide interchange protein
VRAMNKTRTGQRWLGVTLVALAVVAVAGIKAISRSDRIDGLRVAETSADAAVPDLGTASALENAGADAPAQQADPFPTEPAAQIEWVLRNRTPAMILFHSTTCKPCQLMEKAVEKVRSDFEPQVAFVDVVVTDPANANLLRQAQIRTIPTTIFITTSGEAYGFVGAVEQNVLRDELTKLISGES